MLVWLKNSADFMVEGVGLRMPNDESQSGCLKRHWDERSGKNVSLKKMSFLSPSSAEPSTGSLDCLGQAT